LGKGELERRLKEFQDEHNLPGLRRKQDRGRFIDELMCSRKRVGMERMRVFPGSKDPADEEFYPPRSIRDLFRKGELDEAVWLTFLYIHFGRKEESVRLFYGKFGEGHWSWEKVRRDPRSVQTWMRAHGERVKELKFGNHRKYESNDPNKRVGTHAVIDSFVKWARRNGDGSPFKALAKFVTNGKRPEDAFDEIFDAFDVLRFGRTAKFDFLCLLGNLGILRVSPGHCYLRGATGPRTGAILMVTGVRTKRLGREVETRIAELQEYLGVSAEAMEDALCNWQKEDNQGCESQAERKRKSGCA
jgi:hypothetical protein